MVWVRLDDQFPDHPKILAAGPVASWLYVCGLAYSARLLSDGFVPTAQIRKLADVPNPAKLVDTLVRVGLWEAVDGGYMIHDFLEYNPPSEKIRAEREAAKERMRKGRSENVRPNNEGTVNAETTNSAECSPEQGANFGQSSPVPNPIPIPYPEGEGSSLRSSPSSEDEPASKKKARPPDELWDAAVAIIGYEPRTDNERGKLNASLKQLREVEATPAELGERAERYRRIHPDWTFSINAVASHWDGLAVEPAPKSTTRSANVTTLNKLVVKGRIKPDGYRDDETKPPQNALSG